MDTPWVACIDLHDLEPMVTDNFKVQGVEPLPVQKLLRSCLWGPQGDVCPVHCSLDIGNPSNGSEAESPGLLLYTAHIKVSVLP